MTPFAKKSTVEDLKLHKAHQQQPQFFSNTDEPVSAFLNQAASFNSISEMSSEDGSRPVSKPVCKPTLTAKAVRLAVERKESGSVDKIYEKDSLEEDVESAEGF